MAGLGPKIQLDDRIPYYIQVKDHLRELVDGQVLKPGDQLPSEAELCDHFGISRTVVRQALQELEYEGLIRRRKGKGTFIAEPKIVESFVQRLAGFYEDMTLQGVETHADVLRNEMVPAGARVAEYLHVAPERAVVVLERLRYVRDEPIQLTISYIPYDLCPELLHADFRQRSLYAFLEEHGLFLARGLRSIEAVRASERESALMHVEAGTPMLLIDSVGYLEDGTPVEFYRAVHRGDRARFQVEMVRAREARTAGSGLPGHLLMPGIEVLPPT